jgi:hypothetical protein
MANSSVIEMTMTPVQVLPKCIRRHKFATLNIVVVGLKPLCRAGFCACMDYWLARRLSSSGERAWACADAPMASPSGVYCVVLPAVAA